MVRSALAALPKNFAEQIQNVEFTVSRVPSGRSRRQRGLRNSTLYGLYEGVPLTQRDSSYDRVLPDRITIFWGPLVRDFPIQEQLEQEVRKTVFHEIAHYFGLEEDDIAGSKVF